MYSFDVVREPECDDIGFESVRHLAAWALDPPWDCLTTTVLPLLVFQYLAKPWL